MIDTISTGKLQQDPVVASKYELPHTRVADVDIDQITRARADALLQERMSVREALRRYPHAVFWSVLISCGTLMESYDYGLVSWLYVIFRWMANSMDIRWATSSGCRHFKQNMGTRSRQGNSTYRPLRRLSSNSSPRSVRS